ncbi:MAG: hypothetical protein OXQ94_13750 [Gemmatimonadota bacterium]|nr:hypothetical protein [Gemmatimonadota bacterium]MDE2872739.1 hypothetical protein [Gemmatimonadota bacterium]
MTRTICFRAFILTSAWIALSAAERPVTAQEGEKSSSAPEVGILMGFAHFGDYTVIGLPGGALPEAAGPLYFSAPVRDRLSLRVEARFLRIREEGEREADSFFGLGGYATVSLGGGAPGPYILAGGSLHSSPNFNIDETETGTFVAGGLGTGLVFGSGLVARLETRYHRLLSGSDIFATNTIQVFVALGIRIG